MGALTSNRKRSGEDISSPFPSQVLKKPKFSPMHSIINFEKNSQSMFARIQRYPQPKDNIRRQVHGPCRTPKVFLSSMGNVLVKKYDDAKRLAYESIQYSNRKDKAVIDVDDEVEVLDEDDDDVVVLDHGRNRRQSSVGLKERDEKFADKGSSSVVSDVSNQTVKAEEDSLKEFGALSLNHEVVKAVERDELPHKKLYKTAEKRNSRLSYLAGSIEICKKQLALFFPRIAKKPDEGLRRDREPFVPLTKEEEAEVSLALSNSNRRNLLVSHDDSSIEITGEVLQCLRPNAWLNDEVINLYLELLKEREKREPKRFLKCHFFNTFFYKKLISGKGGYDFKAVKRWTTQRKIGYGLVECEKIFVPIHKEIHWCLAIINKKDQKLQYLDSLKGRDSRVLSVLARYYVDEVKDKSGKDIDISSWKQEYVDDLPAQENGFDCGMFMIKYADFYSRGLGLCFSQENMPYFRMRTVKEILRLKAE